MAQVQRSGWPLAVVVRLEGAERSDPSQVSRLLVRSAGGVATPLGEVADVDVRDARDVILHEGGQRRQTVTCNVSGRDVTSFVAEAKQRIEAGVELPGDFYYTVGGTAAARAEAQRDLSFRAGLGALGVVMLLSLVARSGRNLLLLLLNLPLALLGGVLSVAIAGALRGEAPSLSLGSLVGFVTLFGVTTRNAIMMISHFQKLVEEGGAWTEETAIRGAADRLVPIVMTALVTSLGLLPVALASNRPGGEIDGPMATVILGGLVTSTALNLLVLPLLCIRFGRFERPPGGRGRVELGLLAGESAGGSAESEDSARILGEDPGEDGSGEIEPHLHRGAFASGLRSDVALRAEEQEVGPDAGPEEFRVLLLPEDQIGAPEQPILVREDEVAVLAQRARDLALVARQAAAHADVHEQVGIGVEQARRLGEVGRHPRIVSGDQRDVREGRQQMLQLGELRGKADRAHVHQDGDVEPAPRLEHR